MFPDEKTKCVLIFFKGMMEMMQQMKGAKGMGRGGVKLKKNLKNISGTKRDARGNFVLRPYNF